MKKFDLIDKSLAHNTFRAWITFLIRNKSFFKLMIFMIIFGVCLPLTMVYQVQNHHNLGVIDFFKSSEPSRGVLAVSLILLFIILVFVPFLNYIMIYLKWCSTINFENTFIEYSRHCKFLYFLNFNKIIQYSDLLQVGPFANHGTLNIRYKTGLLNGEIAIQMNDKFSQEQLIKFLKEKNSNIQLVEFKRSF